MAQAMVKLEVYLPQSCLDAVVEALHEAGAGRVGLYDHVASWAPVEGCWRPLPGSAPYAGAVGSLCRGQEYKLEMRCHAESVPQALVAVRAVHPYEEPVINVVPLWSGPPAQEGQRHES